METLDVENFNLLFNKKVILCVSGGVDSMVLLDAVSRLRTEKHMELMVCHFEHGIRAEESKRDMNFVIDTCHRLQIPVLVRCENIPTICGGSNVEEVARERRYGFFYEMLKEHQADYLVLAHHMDDNCETVLLHMLRGCGVRGLCGMQRLQGKVVRPLLGYTKAQLMAYAAENRVEYREDSTNSDCTYLRNSIRNEILPLFLDKNPAFIQGMERMRTIVTNEDDFLCAYVENLPWILKKPYGYDIKVDDLKGAHPAIQARSVYYVLGKILGKDLDNKAGSAVLELVDKDTGKQVRIQGVTVFRQESVLAFVAELPRKLEPVKIKIPGVTMLAVGKIVVEEVDNISIDEIKSADPNVAYCTMDAPTLHARSRKDGDRIRTFGGHEKKLKDVMIDRKIPVFMRDTIPVIFSGEGIVFVPGVIRSNKFPFEKTGLKIEYIPKNQ